MLRDVVRIIRMKRPLDAAVALPGQRARRPRQPPDGRPDDGRGVPGRRRSEALSRADRRRPAAMAAAARSTSAACARTRTGRCASTAASTVRGSAMSYDNFARVRPQLPALAEQRPLHADRRSAATATTSACDTVVKARAARSRAFFDGIDTSLTGSVQDARTSGAGGAPARCTRSTQAVARPWPALHDDRSVGRGAGARARACS